MPVIKTTFKAVHKGGTVCDYCRYLVSEGFDKTYRLEIYRDREEPDLIVTNIERIAELEVNGTRWTKYRGKARQRRGKARG